MLVQGLIPRFDTSERSATRPKCRLRSSISYMRLRGVREELASLSHTSGHGLPHHLRCRPERVVEVEGDASHRLGPRWACHGDTPKHPMRDGYYGMIPSSSFRFSSCFRSSGGCPDVVLAEIDETCSYAASRPELHLVAAIERAHLENQVRPRCHLRIMNYLATPTRTSFAHLSSPSLMNS